MSGAQPKHGGAREHDAVGDRGPVAFLREHASAWTERVGGEILAQVETEQLGSDRVRHWLTFLVPELDHEKHRVFFLEHGGAFYPLRAVYFFGQGSDEPEEVTDLADLAAAVGRMLKAPLTRALVSRIRDRIRAQGGLP
jgi:hypothetical protein